MKRLLFIIAFLITYGSVYPFGFRASDGSAEEFLQLFVTLDWDHSRGDLLGNILLFMPFGFVVALMASDSQRPARVIAAYMALGVALAVLLQVLQIWIPGRVAAISDAGINAGGLAAGLLAGLVADRFIHHGGALSVQLASVPLLLALAWVAYRWFPMVPSIDTQNIKNGLKPLFLRPVFDPVRSLQTAVAWLVFFQLCRIGLPRLPLAVLAVVGLGITAGQLLIVSGSISVNNVVGLGAAIVLLPLLRLPHAAGALCLALLLSILVAGVAPFELAQPLNRFRLLPFGAFLDGSMERNLLVLFEKCFLYGAAIYLLFMHNGRLAASSIAVAAWTLLIELVQIGITSRTAEVTDPILCLLIGYGIHLVESSGSRLTRTSAGAPTSPEVSVTSRSHRHMGPRQS